MPAVHVDVTIGGCSLDRKVETKFLGVTIDCNLLWQPHITELTMKISKYIPIFYNIRKILTLPVFRIIYFSFVYPSLTYGNIVMSSSNRLEHSAPLFKNAYLLTLPDINKYSSTIYAFNCVKNARRDIFSLTKPHDHLTRLSTGPVIVLPNIVTTHSMQSVRWVGSKNFNDLPEDIRSIPNLDTFKSHVKRILINQN